jgi:hypothetical protein
VNPPPIPAGGSLSGMIEDEVERSTERHLKRNPGRRRIDGVSRGGIIAMTVSLIFQAGLGLILRQYVITSQEQVSALLTMFSKLSEQQTQQFLQSEKDQNAVLREVATALREQSAACRK